MEKDERGPRRKVTGGAGFVIALDQPPSQADRQERPTSADTTYLRRRGNAERLALDGCLGRLRLRYNVLVRRFVIIRRTE
jgi:hypothetical protein